MQNDSKYQVVKKIILSLHLCLAATIGFSQVNKETSPVKSSSGTMERFIIESAYISNRYVDVWLPENYPADGPYNVLYMHDGQMLFDGTNTHNKQEWCIDEKLDQLVKDKKLSPTIVVGIHNSRNRFIEYYPEKSIPFIQVDSTRIMMEKRFAADPAADRYLQYIIKELKPYVDKAYRVHKDKDHTFVMGASMGGLISLYAICEYPEIFGGAGCMSTGWPSLGDNRDEIPESIYQYMREKLPAPETHRIYFDCGGQTLDAMILPYQQRADKVMKDYGYVSGSWLTLYYPEDAHDEKSWAKHLDKALLFLYLGKE